MIANVLTFEQQIGPLMVTIVVTYVWLLTVNLAAHRFRTMPRAVTLSGVMLGVASWDGAGWRQPGTPQPRWSDHWMGQVRDWLPWVGGVCAVFSAAGPP